MATKLNLAEVTKELNANAGKILEESSRVRKNLDMVLSTLQKKRSAFIKLENEELEKKKREEQKALVSQHAKAWVMPDDDVVLPDMTEQPAEPPAAKPAPIPVEEPKPAKKKPAKKKNVKSSSYMF